MLLTMKAGFTFTEFLLPHLHITTDSGKFEMSDQDDKDYKTEIYTVEIFRHVPSGIAVHEEWKNERGIDHRPPQDGPAVIRRLASNGRLIEQTYVVDGKHVEPEIAGVTRPTPAVQQPNKPEPR